MSFTTNNLECQLYLGQKLFETDFKKDQCVFGFELSEQTEEQTQNPFLTHDLSGKPEKLPQDVGLQKKPPVFNSVTNLWKGILKGLFMNSGACS